MRENYGSEVICPRKLGLQGLYRTTVLVNPRNLKNASLDAETDLCTPSHLINQTKSFGGEVLPGTQETNFEFFFLCVCYRLSSETGGMGSS